MIWCILTNNLNQLLIVFFISAAEDEASGEAGGNINEYREY